MDHGYQVACMVAQLLEPMDGYNAGEKRDICLLAMLHDIGAYKTEEIAVMIHIPDRIDIYMESESADPMRCAASLELGRGTRFSPRVLDLILRGNILRSAAATRSPTPSRLRRSAISWRNAPGYPGKS